MPTLAPPSRCLITTIMWTVWMTNEVDENEFDNKDQDEVVHEEKKSGQNEELPSNISDPVNWDDMNMRFRDLLVEKGPATRLPTNYRFRKDSIGRHFSQTFYIREMRNGEKQDRRWLIYSKALDNVFCFCCKLLRHDKKGGYLATSGYNDWRNLSKRLKEHKGSHDHITCMTRRAELESRLQKK